MFAHHASKSKSDRSPDASDNLHDRFMDYINNNPLTEAQHFRLRWHCKHLSGALTLLTSALSNQYMPTFEIAGTDTDATEVYKSEVKRRIIDAVLLLDVVTKYASIFPRNGAESDRLNQLIANIKQHFPKIANDTEAGLINYIEKALAHHPAKHIVKP